MPPTAPPAPPPRRAMRGALSTLNTDPCNSPRRQRAVDPRKRPNRAHTLTQPLGPPSVPGCWGRRMSKSRQREYFFHRALEEQIWDLRETDDACWFARATTAAANVPLPKHADAPLGEDRHWISDDGNALLVIDGVGGSTDRTLGVDAGVYAAGVRDLVQQIWAAAPHERPQQGGTTAPKPRRTPRLTDVIANAIDRLHGTAHDNPRAWGTAVLAGVSVNPTCWSAEIVHLGDSQVMMFREGNLRFHTKPCYMQARQQGQENGAGHDPGSDAAPVTWTTNMPVQVGTMHGVQKGNFRRDAQTVSMGPGEVRPGDVFVVGSDGLFDNLSAQDIGGILASTCGDGHIKRQLEDGTKRPFYYNRANRKTGFTWTEVSAGSGRGNDAGSSQAAAKMLVQAARRGKKADDITAAVLRVDRPPPLSRDALKAGADARWPRASRRKDTTAVSKSKN